MTPAALPMLLVLAAAPPAREAQRPNSPAVEAIARDYQLTTMTDGDLDGDGVPETLMLFQDGKEGSGVLIMGTQSGSIRYRGCVFLDGVVATDMAAEGPAVTLQVSLDGAQQAYIIRVGEHVGLRGGAGDPLEGVKISASSELAGGMNRAERALDQDVTTSWAEGAPGTGNGQELVFRFKQPFGLAMVGIYPGDGRGPREFKDSNRVRQMTVEVRDPTQSGDESANIDFADLGIAASGARTEVSFANKPEMKFVRITEEHAEQVKLHVDAVFLGDKHDDVHVAEVAFCQLLPQPRVRAEMRKNKRTAPAVKPSSEPKAPR